MRRIKLFQLITLSELGGAQMVVYHLVSGLDREKYDITVACAPGGELVHRLRVLGVRVMEVAALKREVAPAADLAALAALYRLMRRERFHIVHCHSSKAGILGRLAARAAGVPGIIFTVHGWGVNDDQSRVGRALFTAAERLCGRLSSRVVCVSRADLERGRREGLAPPEKLTLIYNGVPAPREGAGECNNNLIGPRADIDMDSGAATGKMEHNGQPAALTAGLAADSCPNTEAGEVVRLPRTPAVESFGNRPSRPSGQDNRRQTLHTIVLQDGSGNRRDGGNKSNLRRELGLDDHRLLVGMVSRLRAPKEPLFFLAAARALLDGAPDGSPPTGAGRANNAAASLISGKPWSSRLHFVLIGDGPLRPACEAYIRENGLEGKVFLTGAREDAADMMASLDVFVLFSRHEGLPLTVIEAMRAGRPVVASAVGGVPELVVPGTTGYLVAPDDLSGAVARLSALLADEGLRRRMGEAGRRRAAENFSVERMVRGYEALYRELLAPDFS